MLRELHISNLAVITDVRIELHAGLNCFTGATGAGKSLVIGAVEVLLGLRNATDLLRPGAQEGRVTGVFEIGSKAILEQFEKITDVPVTADGGELLITRKLHASGRSSVSLNGNPITLGMLKLVAEGLVDVHGQHDHQFLLKPSNQLEVLDQFGDLLPLREKYEAVYQRLAEARRTIDALSQSRSLRDQRLELYRFQANEIDAAEPDAREYAELEARSAVLQNLEKLKKEAGATHAALYESEGSIVDRLKMASAVLADLANLDPQIAAIANSTRDATIALEDAAYDLSRYLDKLDLDPGELDEVSDRLNVLNRILNKYGNSIETTLAHRAELAEQIESLEKQTDDLAKLAADLKPLRAQLMSVGEELSKKRQAVAKKLAPLIMGGLADLGMEKAEFSVMISPATGTIDGESIPATPSGFDQVEFISRTNPGQLAMPLRKIASGGELSRIMLALKGILAQTDRVSVLVFDEIDANVGGRLGSIIGNKLRALSAHHQVLCITHLPQIASYADRHLTVRKEVVGGKTETRVRVMEGADRIEELAEMIGGQRVTDVTRAQANELLGAAKEEMVNVEKKTNVKEPATAAGEKRKKGKKSAR